MKNRSFLGIAFFSLALSPVAFAQFSDTEKDSLDYMHHQNIIEGYEDGTFRPKTNISRAELVKLVMAGAQIEIGATKNCFSDIKTDEWYVSWVCTAKEKGWINGYGDGTFKPEETVNNAEAAKIIVNILDIPPIKEGVPIRHDFSDVPQNAWFYPYVNVLDENYYLDWTQTFKPGLPITREGVAEIVFRNLLTQKQYAPLQAQEVFATRSFEPQKITEGESLSTAARDFFRSAKNIQTLSLSQLTEEQQNVMNTYESAKKMYTGTYPDPENWNYKVMMQDGPFTYGVLQFHDPEREMQTFWRDHYSSWAVLKFDTASQKLLAYDFFTRWEDRPSWVPNIVSVENDKVMLQIGETGPDPTYMIKEGEEMEVKLRNFR